MNTTKRERFLKIAAARTNKVIQTVRLLGNCSNTNNYEYNDIEVKKMFRSIESTLSEVKARFETKKKERFNF